MKGMCQRAERKNDTFCDWNRIIMCINSIDFLPSANDGLLHAEGILMYFFYDFSVFYVGSSYCYFTIT